MTRKYCPFSFSCETITQTPRLVASQCPNLGACSELAKLDGDSKAVHLRVAAEDQGPQSLSVSASSAATLMLRQRGCPQDMESLGIRALMEALQASMAELETQMTQFKESYSGQYIAPEGTEVHAYAVKRPYGTYWYNKLAAHREMFQPQTQQRLVRHIHLGKTGESRHTVAQAGIERRNQLTKARTQLMAAKTALENAMAILQTPIL
ncbi:hypothetical protein N836_03345 [Leptolyngbya sp. Heron Island J]|uniref:hypothetical protein n=1 Tax=Leptolyngbya sp. Heron Island J TaxID=1385935 RepID=UPI0003B9F305|nr:hypothetical protein [Leptolyngbya sp. Heron Island J]ESA37354.1 hypothetical protein N836_03345 [Leptolyngbya sp. Heron Island J]